MTLVQRSLVYICVCDKDISSCHGIYFICCCSFLYLDAFQALTPAAAALHASSFSLPIRVLYFFPYHYFTLVKCVLWAGIRSLSLSASRVELLILFIKADRTIYTCIYVCLCVCHPMPQHQNILFHIHYTPIRIIYGWFFVIRKSSHRDSGVAYTFCHQAYRKICVCVYVLVYTNNNINTKTLLLLISYEMCSALYTSHWLDARRGFSGHQQTKNYTQMPALCTSAPETIQP